MASFGLWKQRRLSAAHHCRGELRNVMTLKPGAIDFIGTRLAVAAIAVIG
jgi:hypothetical protein